MNLNEMLAKRAQLVKDARAIVEEAKKEKRSELSQEENEKYAKIMADVDAIKTNVDREYKLQEEERAAVEAHANAENRAPAKEDDFEQRVRGMLLKTTALDGIELSFRSPTKQSQRKINVEDIEVRDLAKGTATSGGNTVPTGFVRQLYQVLVDTSTMRQTNARVITSTDGTSLPFPIASTHSTAKLFGETVQITTSDPQFTQVTLGAYKYGVIVPVSRELIQDTAVDLLGYIAEECGRGIAINQGVDFAVGNGTGKPKGVIAAATVGVTVSTTNTITANDLISLYHSLTVPYRKNAAWLTNDATVQFVRKLTNAGNIDYVWQPGLQAGVPDTLLGRPLYTDPNIATLATASKVFAIGDYSRYIIRDVGNLRFERSDDFKFDTDMVWFKAVMRSDGNLLDTAAVKTLITS
jgi:HK97 family phage major capsid protein